MAKGKNLNPADAFRKSLRKKELKKNKAERSKAREFALVKKDTQELEEDIQRLETVAELSASDRVRLTDLKSELEKINKKKEEYVKEHPEHRKLVYKARRHNDEEKKEDVVPRTRNLFKKNGLPRHPERSVYYDAVMNPLGVAPPGMPYMERPLRPDEIESDEEDNDDDDDIVMPEGPPPGVQENDELQDSDDDIPMPEGPPPGPSPSSSHDPTPPGGFLPPPPPPGFQHANLPPHPSALRPPAPPGSPASNLPPRPQTSIPPRPPPMPGFPVGYVVPPPQHSYHPFPNFPPHHLPPPPPGFPSQPMPPPPPGFFPRRQQSTSAIQDPLSSVPHQTFQAHHARHFGHPSLPLNPTLASTSTAAKAEPSGANVAAATVSAAPQLRDFKKEATAFIPTSIKRKKPGTSSGSSTKVNAAPSLGPGPDAVDSESATSLSRPDLLGTLKNQFGPVPVSEGGLTDSKGSGGKGGPTASKPKDDYAKFVEEMGDMLRPSEHT